MLSETQPHIKDNKNLVDFAFSHIFFSHYADSCVPNKTLRPRYYIHGNKPGWWFLLRLVNILNSQQSRRKWSQTLNPLKNNCCFYITRPYSLVQAPATRSGFNLHPQFTSDWTRWMLRLTLRPGHVPVFTLWPLQRGEGFISQVKVQHHPLKKGAFIVRSWSFAVVSVTPHLFL